MEGLLQGLRPPGRKQRYAQPRRSLSEVSRAAVGGGERHRRRGEGRGG